MLAWTWKQVCLETDSKGEVGGSKDPRGGWAEIARVLRNWPPCAPGYVLSDWGQSDPNKHVEEVDRFAIPGGSKNKPGGIFY